MTEVPKTTIMKVRRVVEEHWLELGSAEAQTVLSDLVHDDVDDDEDAFADADDFDEDADDDDIDEG